MVLFIYLGQMNIYLNLEMQGWFCGIPHHFYTHTPWAEHDIVHHRGDKMHWNTAPCVGVLTEEES